MSVMRTILNEVLTGDPLIDTLPPREQKIARLGASIALLRLMRRADVNPQHIDVLRDMFDAWATDLNGGETPQLVDEDQTPS